MCGEKTRTIEGGKVQFLWRMFLFILLQKPLLITSRLYSTNERAPLRGSYDVTRLLTNRRSGFRGSRAWTLGRPPISAQLSNVAASVVID